MNVRTRRVRSSSRNNGESGLAASPEHVLPSRVSPCSRPPSRTRKQQAGSDTVPHINQPTPDPTSPVAIPPCFQRSLTPLGDHDCSALAPQRKSAKIAARVGPKPAKTMLKQAVLIAFASSAAKALHAPNLQVLQKGLHTRLQPAAGAGQKSTRRRSTPSPAQAHEPTTALESGAVLRGAVAAVVAAVAPTTVTARRRGRVDYKAVAADIAKIIKSDPDKGPTFLRLAWHSSGDYSKQAQDGGSRGGTIRFKEELAHGGNAGLAKAVKWLEPVKKAHPGASYADIFTLAGVVAIKEANGPIIGWSSGRVDEPVSSVAPDGRLPNADMGSPQKTADHLRDGVFYRMGFDDREIVALSGAHAGRCHPDASWIRFGPLDADADDAQQRLLLPFIKCGVDAARLGRPVPVCVEIKFQAPHPIGVMSSP